MIEREIWQMKRVCWYNLPLNKDERKLIYDKLGFLEWTLVRVAHNPKYLFNHPDVIIKPCARLGSEEILKMIKWVQKEIYEKGWLV